MCNFPETYVYINPARSHRTLFNLRSAVAKGYLCQSDASLGPFWVPIPMLPRHFSGMTGLLSMCEEVCGWLRSVWSCRSWMRWRKPSLNCSPEHACVSASKNGAVDCASEAWAQVRKNLQARVHTQCHAPRKNMKPGNRTQHIWDASIGGTYAGSGRRNFRDIVDFPEILHDFLDLAQARCGVHQGHACVQMQHSLVSKDEHARTSCAGGAYLVRFRL